MARGGIRTHDAPRFRRPLFLTELPGLCPPEVPWKSPGSSAGTAADLPHQAVCVAPLFPGAQRSRSATAARCALQTSLNLPRTNEKKTRGSQRTAGLAFEACVSVTHVTQLAVLGTKLSTRPGSTAQDAGPPAGYINPGILARHTRLLASDRVSKLVCVDITSSNK